MTNRTSLYSNTGFLHLLSPAVRSTTLNTTGMDLQDCDDAALVFIIGDSGDTLSGSLYFELEVQESDDNSTFTAVANADITNYVTGTNVGTAAKIVSSSADQVTVPVGYRGSKRYIRGTIRFTGSHTNGTPVGVIGLRGRNRQQPVNALT